MCLNEVLGVCCSQMLLGMLTYGKLGQAPISETMCPPVKFLSYRKHVDLQNIPKWKMSPLVGPALVQLLTEDS